MPNLASVGIKNFFNSSVRDAPCMLKQAASDFVVQEISPARICGVSPIVNYQGILDAEDVVKTVNFENNTREIRAEIHKKLKYHPFLKANTIDGKIHIEETDVDVYSFVLQKVMFNTVDAVGLICKKLGLSKQSAQYAGNKDRRAITFQEVSLRCSFMKLYDLARELKRTPDLLGWQSFIEEGYTEELIKELDMKVMEKIELIKPHSLNGNGLVEDEKHEVERWREVAEESHKDDKSWIRPSIKIFDIKKSFPKKLGDLSGNRFTVVLHGFYEKKLVENMREGFLNYFGPQRFGNNLTNHEVGRNILEKNYTAAVEGIMKGERCYDLYTAGKYEEASKFGDCTVRYIMRCKEKGLKDRDIILGLRRELKMFYLHSYQSFRFNESINERVLMGLSVVSGDLVMAGNEVKVVEDPEEFTVFDVVLKLERMNDKMLKGGYRKFVEKAYDVVVREGENSIVAGFSLKSSCYATIALREVIGNSVFYGEK